MVGNAEPGKEYNYRPLSKLCECQLDVSDQVSTKGPGDEGGWERSSELNAAGRRKGEKKDGQAGRGKGRARERQEVSFCEVKMQGALGPWDGCVTYVRNIPRRLCS